MNWLVDGLVGGTSDRVGVDVWMYGFVGRMVGWLVGACINGWMDESAHACVCGEGYLGLNEIYV